MRKFIYGFLCAAFLLISCGVAVNEYNEPSQVIDTKNGVAYNIYDDNNAQIVVYNYNGMTCSSSFVQGNVAASATVNSVSTSTSCVALGR